MKYPIRSIFVPPKDYLFLSFDLSQAESWVSAYLAKEETFKENLKSGDVHTTTASIIFSKPIEDIKKDSKERYLGKKSNHGLTYWMTAERFTEEINGESEETGITVSLPQIKKIRDKWLEYYWRIPMWWKEIELELRNSRTLITPYNRKRTFFGFMNNETIKEGIAFVPQSTVADHAFGATQESNPILGGMLAIRNYILSTSFPARLCHTAYDSCMYEVHRDAIDDFIPIVYNAMHRPIIINGEECLIPVDGERGERWGEMEKIPHEAVL